MIPQRFLPPTWPDLSKPSKIIPHAFSLAIVSYFLLVFVGDRYASLHNYHIASNQELIAVGLCNICSSFFKSFAVSSAISGTVIQEKTGGRTQLAAAIGASVMLVTALRLGHFFQMIPNGIFAAIVVFNVLPFLEKFLDVPILWRRDKYHFVIWLVTFAAVLCAGLDVGLAIAMGFTFFIIAIRSHRMKMVVLGQIPNTNIYRSLSTYRTAREIEGIKIFQCCSSISFANVNHFKTYLLHKMDMKAVPLDESEMRALISLSVSDTAVERKDLKFICVCDPPLQPPTIIYMFHNIGITVLIASCHYSVITHFEKSDFFDSCVTKEMFFLTLHDAVLAALGRHQKPDELEPPAEEFPEEPLAEQQKERRFLLKKNKDFFSATNSDNKLMHEESISDTSSSAQNSAEPSSRWQYGTRPLQSDFQDTSWGERWKYTSNP
nr:testis anion transporter 1 isoform X3 [Columba livia]